jgi:hypothetical protein
MHPRCSGSDPGEEEEPGVNVEAAAATVGHSLRRSSLRTG